MSKVEINKYLSEGLISHPSHLPKCTLPFLFWITFLNDRVYMTNIDSILKSVDVTLPTKVHLAKAMVFKVVMYGCESWSIKSWAPKTWCFWTVVLEKTLEGPLDCKEIQTVHPKGNQSWIFWKDWCWSWNSNTSATWCEELIIWKDPDVRKDWGQEDKGTTEDEMIRWHHQLDGHEFEQALVVGDGHGSPAYCSPWGC